MRATRRTVAAFTVVLAASLLAGCGRIAQRPTVVATTGIAASIARAVAGSRIAVDQLVPDSASPHSYILSARDRADAEHAELIVAFGAGLEDSLHLDRLAQRTFVFNRHTGALRRLAAGEGQESGMDPHTWMDPMRIARALPALADSLAVIDPANAPVYRRRAAHYAQRLKVLNRELAVTLSRIPRSRRLLVSSHDSLGYFAERYHLRVLGSVFGASPAAQTSASQVAALIEKIKRSKVPAVFAQRGESSQLLRSVAEQAKVRLVDDLLVSGFGPGAHTYPALLRYDARRIAKALRQ